MSNTDPAARPEGEAVAHRSAADAAETELSQESVVHAAAEADEPREHLVTATEQPVELQRSVRYGRILIGAAVLGAAILSLLSLLAPLDPQSEYSLPQIAGFMALIGAAIGLGLGAVLSVALTAVAKRKHGSGVAIQTDVR